MLKNKFLFPRLIIGFIQGMALYKIFTTTSYSNTIVNQMLIAVLFTLAIFIPIILHTGVAEIKNKTNLFLSVMLVTAILILTTSYNSWMSFDIFDHNTSLDTTFLINHGSILNAIFVFCAWVLILSINRDKQIKFSYKTYNLMFYKLFSQIIFAVGFTLLFWILIELGCGLLNLINIKFISNIIDNPLFSSLATAISLAFGIDIISNKLQNNIEYKYNELTLLLWLSPLIVGLVTIFMAAIPFNLSLLWQQKYLSFFLLPIILTLIIFINLAFLATLSQQKIAIIIQISCKMSLILIMILIPMLSYALFLRISHYGLSVDRIFALIITIILFIYGIGYFFSLFNLNLAAFTSVPATNICVILSLTIITVLIQSPFLDPTKISVNNQIKRLSKVKTNNFDIDYLRSKSGRYGQEMLAQLIKNKLLPPTTRLTNNGLASSNNSFTGKSNKTQPIYQHVKFLTNVAKPLEQRFYQYSWIKYSKSGKYSWELPRCMISDNPSSHCYAFIGNFTDQQHYTIMIMPYQSDEQGVVLELDKNQKWEIIATLPRNALTGYQVREQLIDNKFTLVTPKFKDIKFNNGITLRFNPN